MALEMDAITRIYWIGARDDEQLLEVTVAAFGEPDDAHVTITNDGGGTLSIAPSALPDLIAALQEMAKELPELKKKSK